MDTFLKAINTGDLAQLLSCFSATSVITDAGRRIKGLQAITQWAEEEFLLPHGTLTATDSRPVCGLPGDTVVEARISSAHHNGRSRLLITAIGDTIAYLKVRADVSADDAPASRPGLGAGTSSSGRGRNGP
ncbi:nuclear transport factor 2 family protein [Streptomyces sp. NPDC051322]|uniref:nuclear transport factor 2 family protein n=1 Tax=Streptomyces sp. NPDC051322 TaxID=3154645 RepID=UPI00344CB6F8